MVFITKSYQDLFGVRSYINAKNILTLGKYKFLHCPISSTDRFSSSA